MKYILASASPRRKELLKQAGLSFEIFTSDKEEIITKENPDEIVCELAMIKGQNVLHDLETKDEDLLLISADTIVVYQNQILGKPHSKDQAFAILSMLSDQTHQVYTGVCLTYQKEGQWLSETFYESTDVTFYPVSEAEIRAYIASGDPMDKAGAYGIQGPYAVHIRGIKGDYNNVVGLPIARLYHELKERNLI
ncbi:MAG: Maf family protein [Dorea sp.]|nr:Maf family protein [Dorea sp.]